MLHIIIAGSRTFAIKDYGFIKDKLTEIIRKEQYERVISNEGLEIVSGNASTGADHLGENFAKQNNLRLRLFPADWNNLEPLVIIGTNFYGEYNKLAGTNRNQKMSDYLKENGGGILIAFDGEESKPRTGTKDMIKIAKRDGHKVYHIKCEDRENIKIKVYNNGDK